MVTVAALSLVAYQKPFAHECPQRLFAGTQRDALDGLSARPARFESIGAALIAIRRCSPMGMWMPTRGNGSAYRLLYLAVVRDNCARINPARVRVSSTLSKSVCPGSA